MTVSGGDQFVRADLDEIVRLIRVQIEPTIINIPMNGVITERIFTLLPKIARTRVGSQLVLNLSVDEIGEEHDRIRGADRNFEKLLLVADLIQDLKKTYDAHRPRRAHGHLEAQRAPHPGDRPPGARHVPARLVHHRGRREPRRAEDDRQGHHALARRVPARGLARCKDYIRANRSKHPVARLVESLRLDYYDLAAQILEEKRQVIDCYAGWASAHLAPDGHVWGCCVRAESVGNVRDHGYDFGAVWFGQAADAFRASVKNKECACPLANASYTNMLLEPRTLARVAANMVGADTLLERAK